MTWRERLAPKIAHIVEPMQEAGAPTEAIREALREEFRERYPSARGGRKGFAYRIWLDEARVQLGLAQPRRDRGRPPAQPAELRVPDPNQDELFPELATAELRFIGAVIDAARGRKSAGAIWRASRGLIDYPTALRILDLAGRGAQPAEILAKLKTAREQAAEFGELLAAAQAAAQLETRGVVEACAGGAQ